MSQRNENGNIGNRDVDHYKKEKVKEIRHEICVM